MKASVDSHSVCRAKRKGGRHSGTRDMGAWKPAVRFWHMFTVVVTPFQLAWHCEPSLIFIFASQNVLVILPIHLEPFSFFLDYCIDFSKESPAIVHLLTCSSRGWEARCRVSRDDGLEVSSHHRSAAYSVSHLHGEVWSLVILFLLFFIAQHPFLMSGAEEWSMFMHNGFIRAQKVWVKVKTSNFVLPKCEWNQ